MLNDIIPEITTIHTQAPKITIATNYHRHPQPSVKPTAIAIATASRSQPSTAVTTLTTATTTASCFSPSPPPLSSLPSVAELAYSPPVILCS
ncbi:hypothetical protein AHAS_Ahas10G0104300 [Arachis hypogaea]